MSVGDVVNLIGQVDGFNQRMVDDYSQRLMDNNINGTVLMSCDLAELKPVLQMAFGDWVLFRSLVEYLRYSEQNRESSDGEVTPPTEQFIRSAAVCNTATVVPPANVSTAAVTVGVTDSVASSSKKATSDMTLTSVSNTDAVLAEPSRSSPTLKELPTPADKVVNDGVRKTGTASPKHHPPLSRQDSFVNEVLMESETLRDFIQASVLGSDSEGGNADSDDEVPRPITTIPEETTVVSRNVSASSLGRMSLRQTSITRRMSTESGPIDRAFSVGPDHDSGDSDSEVERLSRKSSVRTKPETDATFGSAAVDEKRKKLTSKSMKLPHDTHRAASKPVDHSKSATKLDKGGSESSVPLMSLYFSMAVNDRNRAGSQGSGYVSPKPSAPAVSQASGPSSRHPESSPPVNETAFCQSSPVAATGLLSWQQEMSSSSDPHPATSPITPSQQPSESGESAEAAASDDVKFFIVDESDSSPKAIMVEMDALPPHRVTSSLTGDTSASQRDPDHLVL